MEYNENTEGKIIWNVSELTTDEIKVLKILFVLSLMRSLKKGK